MYAYIEVRGTMNPEECLSIPKRLCSRRTAHLIGYQPKVPGGLTIEKEARSMSFAAIGMIKLPLVVFVLGLGYVLDYKRSLPKEGPHLNDVSAI